MKRVETIHINGIVFSIEDDAFGKLSAYLDALGKYFEAEPGGNEIIADIEARIAELFTERDGRAGQAVTLADVTGVIETLGTPEDIADTETEELPPPRSAKPPRRLYRDPDRRYLGGVCSGIAAWLGVTPLAVRLIFLILTLFYFFYGAAVIVYILLWIIIPKAKTTAQKLEMQGKPINIGNIEKNIRENFSDPSLKHSFRNFLNEAGEFFGRLFGVLGRVIAILLGIFLCGCGIIFAISLICLFSMQDLMFNHVVEWDFLSFTELFRHILSPASCIALVICLIMVVVLPIFALLFWGVKLMTGFRVKHKVLHVSLFVLWLAVMIMGLVVCISQARSFAWRNEQIVKTQSIAPADTLYLASAPSDLQISDNPMGIYFDRENRCFYGKPNLEIRKSDNGEAKLQFKPMSQGESKRAACRYAEGIEYAVDVRGSLLVLDPYFTVSPQEKWKFQSLDVTLYIPAGTVIIFDKTISQNRVPRAGVLCKWDDSTPWVMTKENGFKKKMD